MLSNLSDRRGSPLRARMIEDMTVRGFTEKTRQRLRSEHSGVRGFHRPLASHRDARGSAPLPRLHQTQSGMQPPSIEQRGLSLAASSSP